MITAVCFTCGRRGPDALPGAHQCRRPPFPWHQARPCPRCGAAVGQPCQPEQHAVRTRPEPEPVIA